jgi:hypothetical protein
MAAAHKWAKGQSGNPSGLRKDGQPRKKRGKKPPGGPTREELVSLARSYGPEMIERLLFWARSKNARMSVRAAQLLIERGYGIPPASDRIESTLVLPGDGKGDEIVVTFVKPQPQPDEGWPRLIHSRQA